jgi:hypothetical protein
LISCRSACFIDLSPVATVRRRALGQQRFEVSDIIEQRFAPALGQRIEGLGFARDKALLHLDITGVFELAQVNAGIAVGRPGGVAYCHEIGGLGAGEKGDDGEPHAARQHLVDRRIVEIGHASARSARLDIST